MSIHPNPGGVRRPLSALRVLAKIDVPGSPDWVAADADAVWVSNAGTGNLDRIDPAADRLAASVPVGRRPCAGIGVGFGSLWVPTCGDGALARVNPALGRVEATVPIAVADSEGGIAVTAEGVWVPTGAGDSLARVDPDANAVASTVPLPPGSFAAAAGFGAVWVTNTPGGFVSRVDPAAGRVTNTIAVGPSPRFLAVGEGAVWVLNQGDGSVSRIDPVSGAEAVRIPSVTPGGPGGDIAAGLGGVWVAAVDFPLARIDPSHNQITRQYQGRGGDAVGVGHGSVWLSSFILKQVWRVDPSDVDG